KSGLVQGKRQPSRRRGAQGFHRIDDGDNCVFQRPDKLGNVCLLCFELVGDRLRSGDTAWNPKPARIVAIDAGDTLRSQPKSAKNCFSRVSLVNAVSSGSMAHRSPITISPRNADIGGAGSVLSDYGETEMLAPTGSVS